MKRFLRYLLLFIVNIAVLDICFGYLCSYLNSHAKGGDTYNHYHIANEMTDSVLTFGSSRAIHHYNPSILEDSLGTTVYNCGLDGNGIIYNYGRLLTILNRYTPKIIIYDVMPSFDMKEDDYSKYLQWQKRWYDTPGIQQIFSDVNPLEPVKMLSSFYRYNSTFIQMLSDYVKPQQQIAYKGYKPLDGEMNYDITDGQSSPAEWSELKYVYFKKFVDLCKQNDIKLIISYSPQYKAKNSIVYDEFTKFAKSHDLELIDMYSDSDISFNKNYFEDASHLNSKGADLFTSKFANILKDRL